MTYKIGYDIVVNEEDCEKMGKEYETMAQTFEQKLTDYLASLDHILAGAVKSGQVAGNLALFQQEVKGLQKEVEEISKTAKEKATSFGIAIDEADKELF
ncbi:hypothetical protein HCC36_06660 [Listeria booriae]|uniref:LXG domain-containing protein n=1 Tax=Listeria booriae TaxID=1552123 RepID=A0A842G9Q7_9LIST|nr:hypothetical protein [Listeria booriae]MBC2292912.1 hypothetical protein [Listeria booriae]